MNKMTLKEAQEVLGGWKKQVKFMFDASETFRVALGTWENFMKDGVPIELNAYEKFIATLLEAARVVEREKIRKSIDFYLKKEQENPFFSFTDNLEKLKKEILSDNQDNHGN